MEDFHVQNSKKWNSAAAGNPYTLSKVTSLTETEIKTLQKAFCHGFTPLQVVEQPIVEEAEFVCLVEAYYRILKQESEEGESILEISSYFLRKIFRTYLQEGQQGLAFRYISLYADNSCAASPFALRAVSRSVFVPF